MGQKTTPSLIDILQKTLQQLESTEGLDRADPAYVELTRHIARAIAEIEIAKLEGPMAA
jgi:hypothetical protein